MKCLIIDIDGVLADFSPAFRAIGMRTLQRILPDIPFEDSWDLSAAYGLGEGEEVRIWQRIHESPVFWLGVRTDPSVTEQTMARIAAAQKQHDVYFVTLRQSPTAKQQTEAWLARRGVVGATVIKTLEKGLIAYAVGADAIIEDNPLVIEQLLELPGERRIYLRARPYNEELIGREGVIPVRDVDEFLTKEGL